MEIKEFKAFVLLAEHLHFGRAAKRLNLTQPALTKQIHKLEAFLGTPLFERDTQGTRLTTFGQQMLKEAQVFIAHYEQLCLLGKTIARGERGLLRIGLSFYALDFASNLIARFRESRPHIELTLRDLSSYAQLEALRTRQLDIVFAQLSTASEFNTFPLIMEHLSLITPNCPAYSQVSCLSECAELPFIIVSGELYPALYDQLVKLCANAGFHPKIVQEVAEVTSVLALVKAGLGVSILPLSICSSNFSGIKVHPQTGQDAAWTVLAAWRKEDHNPALAAFVELLQETFS